MKIDYRVTPKTVYLVERLETADSGDEALAICGECDSEAHAYQQAELMAFSDRERMQIAADDPRVTCPEMPEGGEGEA